jgi:hypothetical protein
MPLEHEVSSNRLETREKSLRAFRVAKAAHATLAFARRLVAIFCAVIYPSGGFYKHMLNARQLGGSAFAAG